LQYWTHEQLYKIPLRLQILDSGRTERACLRPGGVADPQGRESSKMAGSASGFIVSGCNKNYINNKVYSQY